MLRTFASALLALVFVAGGVLADEIKGKIKSIDAAKNSITVTVADKDTEYKLAPDAKVIGANDKELKDGLNAKQLQNIKPGQRNVVLTTEKKDGKDVVTQVKLGGGKKQDK
jgi:hypothetical protein